MLVSHDGGCQNRLRIYGRSSRRAQATNPAARAVRRVARTRTQGVRLCARPHAPSAGACVALVGARFVRLFRPFHVVA